MSFANRTIAAALCGLFLIGIILAMPIVGCYAECLCRDVMELAR